MRTVSVVLALVGMLAFESTTRAQVTVNGTIRGDDCTPLTDPAVAGTCPIVSGTGFSVEAFLATEFGADCCGLTGCGRCLIKYVIHFDQAFTEIPSVQATTTEPTTTCATSDVSAIAFTICCSSPFGTCVPPHDLIVTASGAGGPVTTVDAGRAAGRPGGTACLPVTLASGPTNVASTTNDLGFDPVHFSFSGCAINPGISGFGLNKVVGLTPIDAGTERVTLSDANHSPTPDGLLYTCSLAITPTTAASSYSITNTPTANDEGGNAIPNVVGAAGQVIVTSCTGDCNGDGRVKIGEVIRCVNLFLGQPLCSPTDPALNCPVADASLDGHVSVGEVIQCVNRFLNGC